MPGVLLCRRYIQIVRVLCQLFCQLAEGILCRELVVVSVLGGAQLAAVVVCP